MLVLALLRRRPYGLLHSVGTWNFGGEIYSPLVFRDKRGQVNRLPGAGSRDPRTGVECVGGEVRKWGVLESS